MNDDINPRPTDIVAWKNIVLSRLSTTDNEGRLALSCLVAALMRYEDEKTALAVALENARYQAVAK